MLGAFLRLNRAASDRWYRLFPHGRVEKETRYVDAVVALAPKEGGVVLDFGGGAACRFAGALREAGSVRILAVDVLARQLRANKDADWRVVGEVIDHPCLRDGAVDCIASRSVLEHLPDMETFVRRSRTLLRPGGGWVHLFPARYALFAILNRRLPRRLKRLLLRHLVPSAEELGFPAHYDRCTADGMDMLLRAHGFEAIAVEPVWSQASYYRFCFPLFVAVSLYEALVRALGWRRACGYLIVTARVPVEEASLSCASS